MDARLDYPHVHRNRQPIADALAPLLPQTGLLLEVASGSGQHMVYFAERFPELTFQPSDLEERALASIAAWIEYSGVGNVRPPMRLDVCAAPFPLESDSVDVIYNANMIHIAPWEACIGLLDGAAKCLRPGGSLIMYGPYQEDGQHTAPSNAGFDADLQRRDPRWGVRELAEVKRAAAERGLHFSRRISMPANNLLLAYQKQV